MGFGFCVVIGLHGRARPGFDNGNDLVVVHETRRHETQRGPVGADVAGDVQPRGLGDQREGGGLGETEGGGQRGHPLAAGCLQHGLPLLVGESPGERGGQGFLDQRVHGSRRRQAFIASTA